MLHPNSISESGYWQIFLFDQTSVSFLKLLLGLSVYLLVKSSFSKNPAKSVYQEPPTRNIWSGSSSSTVLQVMSVHARLSSAKILLGEFTQNLHVPLMFLLSNFHPLTPTLLFRCIFLLAYIVLGIEPHSILRSFPPIAIVLNKICFYGFNYYPALVFLWQLVECAYGRGFRIV